MHIIKLACKQQSTNGRCLMMHDRIMSSVLFRLDQETDPWIFQQLLLPILTSLSHTKHKVYHQVNWFFFIDLNVWIHSFCVIEKEPQYQVFIEYSVPTNRILPVWRLTARKSTCQKRQATTFWNTSIFIVQHDILDSMCDVWFFGWVTST